MGILCYLLFIYIFILFYLLFDDFSYLFGNFLVYFPIFILYPYFPKVERKETETHQLLERKDDRKVKKEARKKKDPKVKDPSHIVLLIGWSSRKTLSEKRKETLSLRQCSVCAPSFLSARSKKGTWLPP
jgi:hypothetical protein